MSKSPFDGYNNESEFNYNHKQEQSENWSQAIIFLPLFLMLVALLAVIIYLNVIDLKLKYTGNVIEINCTKGTTLSGKYKDRAADVSYLNDNGELKFTYMTEKGGSVSEMQLASGCAFKDAQDNIYLVRTSKTIFSEPINKKITVYYYGDDMASARTLTVIWVWILAYVILIPILIFLVICTYKTLHKTNYAQTKN